MTTRCKVCGQPICNTTVRDGRLVRIQYCEKHAEVQPETGLDTQPVSVLENSPE